MKPPRQHRHYYREAIRDLQFRREVDESFKLIGINAPQLSAYLEGERAIRFAQGRATKLDFKWREWQRKRAVLAQQHSEEGGP